MNFEIILYPLLWRCKLFGLFGHSYNTSAWTTEELYPVRRVNCRRRENDKSIRITKGSGLKPGS